MFSLPGGRILLGESLEKASQRIMKEKFNINANFKKLNSISFEQVKKSGKIIHSFILFFVTATTKDKIELADILECKTKIISSDYKLITEDSNKETKIKTIFSKTN
jgi:ADP-ribose pyrophosphatase YjhB (NUDIX family)